MPPRQGAKPGPKPGPLIPAFSPEKLRALRTAKGWTLARLAAETNFVYKTVESWDRGDRAPAPANLVLLARALHIHPAELLSTPRDQWGLPELRAVAGLRQVDVVKMTRMSPERVRHIESGINPLPDDLADRLAELYQSTPDEVRACWSRSRNRERST